MIKPSGNQTLYGTGGGSNLLSGGAHGEGMGMLGDGALSHDGGAARLPDRDVLRANVDLIIRLQSLWRGFKVRKIYEFYKNHNRNNKYFTYEEYMETIDRNGKKYNPNQRRERRTHQYQSGAVYEGEWIGGMRSGYGKMTWPDKAFYEGEWQHGKACGQGKFTYEDGDEYDG